LLALTRIRWGCEEWDVMDRVLAIPLDDSGDAVALFEVDARLVGSDLELAAHDHGAFARARVSLDEALRTVRPAIEKVVHAVRAVSPDSMEIEFGLKLGGESGVIIAKGTSELNFSIRLSWESRKE
jgi:hypothetical protein